MHIREVTEKDLPAWSSMRTALWPETEDAHIAEIQAFFAGTSVDIEQTYIAEEAGKPIGFIELNLRNFAEGSAQPVVPYVEGWYVVPTARGRGCGRQLMRYAELWAKKLGYQELASDTEIDNHASMAMHEHMGFEETERVVCYLKRLTQDDEEMKQ